MKNSQPPQFDRSGPAAAPPLDTALSKARATPQAARPGVSVIIPAKNEAGNIGPLVDEIAAALDRNWDFEVVCVNDGSTDAMEDELAALAATRPWLRHLRHPRSFGQSAGLRTGVAAAKGPLIVTLDGDGQNDPAFVPALLDALVAGGARLGLVAGQRTGRKDTAFKRWQSRTANGIRRAILRDGTRDTGCGLKAFPRDVFMALPYFDGLHRFLPALVRRDGYEIAYVDVVDRPRRHDVSNYGMLDRLAVGAADLLGVWWLTRRSQGIPRAEEGFRHADGTRPAGENLRQ